MTTVTERHVALPLKAWWHGDETGYTNHGCRCLPCTGAHSNYQVQRRRNRLPTPFEDIPHGTYSSYNYHKCRCPQCSLAKQEYNRSWREGKKAAREQQQSAGSGLQGESPRAGTDDLER